MNEQDESMNLFDALVLMRDRYLLTKKEKADLYEKMNEELAESARKIKQAYQEKITISQNNCLDCKNELDSYKKLLEDYSTFDSRMIGNVLEKLVSLVEGENYSYQESEYETFEYKSTVFGSESFNVNKKLLMIVNDKYKQEYYYDHSAEENEIAQLVRNNQAFVLAENKFDYDKKITFYTASDESVNCLIDFNEFSYVKTFINRVIQYRFENHLDTISEKDLLSIMSEFILSEKEMIEGNYQKRAIKKQEQLKQELSAEWLRYQEEVKQLEFDSLLENAASASSCLAERLQESISNNPDLSQSMSQFVILYEGAQHTAKIQCSEPILSAQNILISKINIESTIKDYFDDTESDPHFHGYCDIDLVDDGLIGIVDVSNFKQNLNGVIPSSLSDEYKVDRINDEYLRVLYLPNRGEYHHRPINGYHWILDGEETVSSDDATSYKTEWNSMEEADRMLTYLEQMELSSNSNELKVLHKNI